MTGSVPYAGQPTTHVELVDEGTKVKPGATKEAAPKRQPPQSPRSAPRRQPHPDAIIPDRGLPRIWYGFNRAIGRPDKVPPINAAQRQALLNARISELKFRLYWLASIPGLQPIISVVNIKGGASKTTTALYVGSFISEVTRKMTLVLPATSNTATSTVAEMAGLEDGSTIAISKLNQYIKKYDAYRAISTRIRRTKPWGLAVVSKDPDNNASVSNIFDGEQFGTMVETILPNVDALILDGGNDNVQVGSIPLESVRRATVVVFTSTADQGASVDKIQPTMAAYRTDVAEGDHGAGRVSTRDKINNSIVVVSKLPAGREVDFEELLSMPEGAAYEPFTGRTMTIPEDPYMLSHEGRVPHCNIDRIQPETQAAYLELAVACYEKTAELTGIELSEYSPQAFEDVVSKKPIIRPAK